MPPFYFSLIDKGQDRLSPQSSCQKKIQPTVAPIPKNPLKDKKGHKQRETDKHGQKWI